MIVVEPKEINDTNLTSNVPLDDYPAWTSGTYDEGDRVILGTEVYEVAASSTTDRPDEGVDADPPTWVRIGYANRWRMFRDGRDSLTDQDGGIETSIDAEGIANAVGVLNVTGKNVTVRVTDDIEGVVYEDTRQATDATVGNWYDFYFAPYKIQKDFVFVDLPPYLDPQIDIEVSTDAPEDPASVGIVAIGRQVDLGMTLHGTSVSNLDYSIKERDGFGNLRLVPRRSVRLVRYNVMVESAIVDSTYSVLSDLSTVPALYIGSEKYGSAVVYGIFRDFNIDITGPSASEATIEVEGF